TRRSARVSLAKPLHRLGEPRLVGAHREPYEPLAPRAEPRGRRGDDPRVAEELAGKLDRRKSARHADEAIERRARFDHVVTERREATAQDFDALFVNAPHVVDAGLIAGERGDTGLLHRFEHAAVDIGLYLAERADELAVSDGESGAPAGHVVGL